MIPSIQFSEGLHFGGLTLHWPCRPLCLHSKGPSYAPSRPREDSWRNQEALLLAHSGVLPCFPLLSHRPSAGFLTPSIPGTLPGSFITDILAFGTQDMPPLVCENCFYQPNSWKAAVDLSNSEWMHLVHMKCRTGSLLLYPVQLLATV